MNYRGKTGWEAVLLKRSHEIKDSVRRRGIGWLSHFTWIENIEGIITHGLVPRQLLSDAGVPFWYSDPHRLDGRPDATSLSIGSVNEQMLSSKIRDAIRRGQHPDHWIVLHLDPSILWTARCRFCPTNAASSDITKAGSLDASRHFEAMFAGRETDCPCPTDSQAEIQVLDVMPPDLILAIQTSDASLGPRIHSQLRRLSGERHVILGNPCWSPADERCVRL